MNSYEAKQEARRERLNDAAERVREESGRLYQGARSALAGIEPGQPILVGHHSERRHRRAIEKHDNRMRQAGAAAERAGELAHRAAAVGTGGISSDDPDAVAKLREKLAGIEAERDMMKAVNAAWRKSGPARDQALAALGTSTEAITRAMAKFPAYERAPFPGYALSNAGAEARRVRERIEDLTRRAADVSRSARFEGGPVPVEVTDDVDDNRVAVAFPKGTKHPDDPCEQLRAAIKPYGFKWSPTRDAWVRHRSTGGGVYRHALAIVGRVLGVAPVEDAPEVPPEGAAGGAREHVT